MGIPKARMPGVTGACCGRGRRAHGHVVRHATVPSIGDNFPFGHLHFQFSKRRAFLPSGL